MWDKEKHGMRGIGIATFRLQNRDKMTIKVENRIYEVAVKQIIEFMNANPRSKFKVKGTTLYVIPISLMTFIKELKSKKKKLDPPKKEEPKEEQLTLL